MRVCVFEEEENEDEKVNVIRILVSQLCIYGNELKCDKIANSKRFSEFIISRAKNQRCVCTIGIVLLSFSLSCQFMLIFNISENGIS